MSDFGSSGRYGIENSGSGQGTMKDVVVSDIKSSHERGKTRIIAREKTSSGQAIAIDIPISEARGIERKESYSFNVREKTEDRYGRAGRQKATGFKSYYCDEAPEKYDGDSRSPYKSFDNSSRIKTTRTRF